MKRENKFMKVFESMFQYLRKKTPSWQLLIHIGNNKIIKSSYIWIVIIPIIAKSLEKIPQSIHLPFDKIIEIQLTLPFSWQVLYFSALAFALSTCLFALFCPQIIEKFSNIEEYKNKGLNQQQLITIFSSWIKSNVNTYNSSGKKLNRKKIFYTVHKNYCEKLDDDILNSIDKSNDNFINAVNNLKIKNESFNDTFWYLRNIIAQDRVFIRFLITLFYFFGFLMLGKLLIDNINTVLEISKINFAFSFEYFLGLIS